MVLGCQIEDLKLRHVQEFIGRLYDKRFKLSWQMVDITNRRCPV